MQSSWIETAAKGRHGGPVRAGMWSAVVLGTHPIESGQEIWLELSADDVPLGPLPGYWIENKGANSLWHVPIPPQTVGARLHYRSAARKSGGETIFSAYQDTVVRPNLPDRTESTEVVPLGPEGLVGNRMMTVRVDARGATYDIYYPTVGLHADVRPADGELPQSRSHFRAIVGGLAVGRRLDWLSERLSWEAFQYYHGANNLLRTELTWRNGPVRVLVTDFAAIGRSLPKTAGGTESPGQYVKRFRVTNEGTEARRALFGVYIQAEVNGGIGEPGLTWHDGGRTLLAINRGHAHANRKLARDATVEFAIALDARGEVHCEPTGPNEAILLRWLDLPAGESVTVDLLVSGAFTGWRGDPGTFDHWLEPALAWFRGADLDSVEQTTALEWDAFIEPLPSMHFPRPAYAVTMRRSALAAALHADATWGAVASGFDRGLSAYCYPREAILVGCTFDRIGHPEIGGKVYQWLSKVRGQNHLYAYWFQKYTIDGVPEWETPAVDQTALIPWGLERHYRRTGDVDLVAASWPMIEKAAAVATGASGHPGLRRVESLELINSAGIWDHRYGAFLYSNCAVVAGLRAAARLADLVGKPEPAKCWLSRAETIWEKGILGESVPGRPEQPGLVDTESGRFLEARGVSTLRGLWTENPALLIDRSTVQDISMLGLVVPFGLLPASDPRVVRSAEGILRASVVNGDANALARWTHSVGRPERSGAPSESYIQDVSSLATLWMARYLIQLGRETGQARHWNRALAMLDGVLGRLLPLGLSIRTASRAGESVARLASGTSTGVWTLHSMLIETMLDFAGLECDVPARRVSLAPALPTAWAHTGLSQSFPCGEVSYRLERPIGGTVHHLGVKARMRHPVALDVAITCPGLTDVGPWQSAEGLPPPSFEPHTGRLAWTIELPKGESGWGWTWG
jgi:GH15 family glucan-1,4-alpha-glucosidase